LSLICFPTSYDTQSCIPSIWPQGWKQSLFHEFIWLLRENFEIQCSAPNKPERAYLYQRRWRTLTAGGSGTLKHKPPTFLADLLAWPFLLCGAVKRWPLNHRCLCPLEAVTRHEADASSAPGSHLSSWGETETRSQDTRWERGAQELGNA
jgi:hypothetical protein